MPGDNKYSIEYLLEVVERDIPKLDHKVKNIIKRKIEKLATDPNLGIPLRAKLSGCYKLKVSKYRIIYKVFKSINNLIKMFLKYSY